ncbi:hypothetical protein [Methylocaldum sp.]|uniref:hypothetical protein n=1 Tax=Methylocaldum sp. TaxID=1969727 RepID=UPI002D4EA897|nr:hypothetical protein [Methylocaldum sp.]HYE34619.1 hypothetical protein [Methylocaldum sp.]
MTEPNFDLAECFHRGKERCVIPVLVQPILYSAHRAFMDVLHRYTLADVAETCIGQRGSNVSASSYVR